MVGMLGHSGLAHGHITGYHLANSFFQSFLGYAECVGDIMPHRVHRMVGFVTVKGPIPRCISYEFYVTG